MALFGGSSKPVVFDRYAGSGRKRRRAMPRWLLPLVLGIASGAGGVLWVQHEMLPPRLSAAEAAELRGRYEQAEAERQRLAAALKASDESLARAHREKAGLAEQLASSQASGERMKTELAALVEALPPDPRGGSVEVRAADFSASGGALDYEIIFTRASAASDKALPAVLQLVVSGQGAKGGETTTTLDPLPLSIGSHQVVRGKVPLPAGFRPSQATIRVLDKPGGRQLGMRVMRVR